MADYYTTNAYSRNTTNNSNPNNTGSSNNGYYSRSYNENSNNDVYSNPYGGNTNNTATASGDGVNPQMQQNQQQPQQQQPSSSSSIPIPSLWNPVMTAAINSATNPNSTQNKEAMYQFGLQVGHRFLDEGTARLIPGLETFMKTLRVYFAVDNDYVKRKMMRVLCSFVCKNWNRLVSKKYYCTVYPGTSIEVLNLFFCFVFVSN